jgi:hypothetical protein
MNGLQLTNSYRTSLRLSRSIQLKEKPIPPTDVVEATDSMLLNVAGTCGMCKTRIEDIAMATPGVATATYYLERQTLQVNINSSFELHVLVLALLDAGHDTDDKVASQEAYDALHSCCKYREIEE